MMGTAFTRPGLVICALLVMATTAAMAEDLPGDPVAGRHLAESWCIACHEVAPSLRGSGALGAPAFQEVADDRAVTALALKAFLQTPHFEMPDFMLDPEETDAVISYILSLREP